MIICSRIIKEVSRVWGNVEGNNCTTTGCLTVGLNNRNVKVICDKVENSGIVDEKYTI